MKRNQQKVNLPSNVNWPPSKTKTVRKYLSTRTNEQLHNLIANSPYQHRGEAIGNNEKIQLAFEILHHRQEIDCATAYCYEH